MKNVQYSNVSSTNIFHNSVLASYLYGSLRSHYINDIFEIINIACPHKIQLVNYSVLIPIACTVINVDLFDYKISKKILIRDIIKAKKGIKFINTKKNI